MNWSVYGLIDPRDRRVFYIGVTANTKQRLSSHMSDQQSAAWAKCNEIKQSGSVPLMCIFGETDVYAEAIHLESALIIAIPHTYNRTFSTASQMFWEPFLSAQPQAERRQKEAKS